MRRSTAPPRTCCARERRTASSRDWQPTRRRRAAVLLAGLRPAGRHASRGRRTGSSPSTTRRPTTSTSSRPEALAASFRAALEIIDVVETNATLPQPVAVRRAAAREARPLPERSRRDEPGGSRLLWVLSLSDGAHDLLAIAERSGLPYRGDPRGGRDARAARAPRASAVSAGRGRHRHRSEPRDRTGHCARAGRGRVRRRARRPLGMRISRRRVDLVRRARSDGCQRRRRRHRRPRGARRGRRDRGASRRPDHRAREQRRLVAGDRAALGGAIPTTGGWTCGRASAAPSICCREVVPRMIERRRGAHRQRHELCRCSADAVPDRIRRREGRRREPDRGARGLARGTAASRPSRSRRASRRPR